MNKLVCYGLLLRKQLMDGQKVTIARLIEPVGAPM
jgi:hypothetical protein